MGARRAERLIITLAAAVAGVFAGLAIARARRTALKARMALSGDWERQFKAEHRRLRRVVKEMAEAEVGAPARRAALLAEFEEKLTRHALEEENVVYPALKSAGADEPVRALVEDHAEMKALVRSLERLGPEDPLWEPQSKALKDLFYRHAREEERELFPLLHELADRPRNRVLTRLVRREGARLTG